jgi:hypothetical protein
MSTEQVEHVEAPMYHHLNNLSYTATGYGAKLPTQYKIKWAGRWYRVYSICFSNCSTEYILSKGKKIIVTNYDAR